MKAMNSLKYAGLAALVSSVAFATNITIADPFANSPTFNNAYTGLTPDVEAGHVESGSTYNNDWDLAKFEQTGSSLIMSGGFNFKTGGPAHAQAPFPIGDIFVYSAYPFVSAGDANKNSWSHVIHFERDTALPGQIYPVQSNPVINGSTIKYQILTAPQASLIYTQGPLPLISNIPWMVGDTNSTWYNGTYSTGTGVSGLFTNSITVDLSPLWALLPADSDYYLHVTMRCGNDVMFGHGRVPDGGITLVLLSLGLSGLALAVRRRK